jgi:threonine/homoserine/homoserine lactone efflux protein
MLTATGANVGIARGLPCLLGVAAGMGIMMFAVGFGLGRVLLDHPAVLEVVRCAGAAVLLWLAWKIATARGGGGAAGAARPVGFGGAVVFQWINPKSWLVCASAAGAFLHEGSGSALAQSAALGVVFAAVSLPSCLPWLAFGAALQRALRSERALRVFNVAMGALLAASLITLLR